MGRDQTNKTEFTNKLTVSYTYKHIEVNTTKSSQPDKREYQLSLEHWTGIISIDIIYCIHYYFVILLLFILLKVFQFTITDRCLLYTVILQR